MREKNSAVALRMRFYSSGARTADALRCRDASAARLSSCNSERLQR